MSVVSFEPRKRIPLAASVKRRSFSSRRALRRWWRGLPFGLRDGLIIVAVLAILLAFSSLLHHLMS